ncbi:MAG: hypothetical protein L6W00_26430 [Lentisphaeria bacterium]|nr:MAG: hypothetical protein L6W00_26430 [Lentisphaeria bacterium]
MPVTALRRIGAKWIRFGIEWQHAEPRPGKFNSGVITNRRNYAALGMAELCTLANPPAWAKKNGAQPENPAVTAEFLARVLRGTRDTVACYELDNEPDLKQNTSPAAYAAWLQAVHPSFATRARSCSSGSPAAVLNLQNRSFDALPEVSISTDLTPTPVLVTSVRWREAPSDRKRVTSTDG